MAAIGHGFLTQRSGVGLRCIDRERIGLRHPIAVLRDRVGLLLASDGGLQDDWRLAQNDRISQKVPFPRLQPGVLFLVLVSVMHCLCARLRCSWLAQPRLNP